MTQPTSWSRRGWAVAVAVLVLVGAGVFVAWPRGANLAHVSVRVATPCVVEFRDAASQRLVAQFTAPNFERRALPAGEYDVIGALPGDFDPVRRVLLQPGERTLDIPPPRASRLLADIPTHARLVRFDHREDLLALPGQFLERWDATEGTRRWRIDLSDSDSPFNAFAALSERDRALWHRPRHSDPWPALDQVTTLDMTGDGRADLVVPFVELPWLLALDGATGRALWLLTGDSAPTELAAPAPPNSAPAPPNSAPAPPSSAPAPPSSAPAAPNSAPAAPNSASFPLGDPFDQPGTVELAPISGRCLGRPCRVPDLDGDGRDELLVTFAVREAEPRLAIKLISGKTGERFWQCWAPTDGLRDNRWVMDDDPYFADEMPLLQATWEPVDAVHAEPRVRLVAGDRIVTWHGLTGQFGSVQPLGFSVSAREIRGDLNSDGRLDSLLCETLEKIQLGVRLHAWAESPDGTSRRLWSHALARPNAIGNLVGRHELPLLEDLDGDGRSEVLLNTRAESHDETSPWREFSVLNGTTGEFRWRVRRLVDFQEELPLWMAGDDINGDGHRDLFLVGPFGADVPFDSFIVEAISGHDGRPFWRTQQKYETPYGGWIGLQSIRPWAAGDDGWQQLLVVVGGHEHVRGFGFSAGTGRPTFHIPDVANLNVADLDGDGRDDLLFRMKRPDAGRGGSRSVDENSHFRVVSAGLAGDRRWLRQRSFLRQVVTPRGLQMRPYGAGLRWLTYDDGCVVALQPDTGRVEWSVLGREPGVAERVVPLAGHTAITSAPPPDVDRDGVADCFLTNLTSGLKPVVEIFSGRNGRHLWRSEWRMTVSFDCPVSEIVSVDLDADGVSEILHVGVGTDDPARAMQDELFVTAIDSRSGRTRWNRRIAPGMSRPHGWFFDRNARVDDLNGDGMPDLLLMAWTDQGPTWHALHGRDGAVLWQTSGDPPLGVAIGSTPQGSRQVVVLEQRTSPTRPVRIRSLDGVTGAERWRQDIDHPGDDSNAMYGWTGFPVPLELRRKDRPS